MGRINNSEARRNTNGMRIHCPISARRSAKDRRRLMLPCPALRLVLRALRASFAAFLAVCWSFRVLPCTRAFTTSMRRIPRRMLRQIPTTRRYISTRAITGVSTVAKPGVEEE